MREKALAKIKNVSFIISQQKILSNMQMAFSMYIFVCKEQKVNSRQQVRWLSRSKPNIMWIK